MSQSRSSDRLSKWPSKFLFFDFYERLSKCSGLPPQIIDADVLSCTEGEIFNICCTLKRCKKTKSKIGLAVLCGMHRTSDADLDWDHLTTFNVSIESSSGLRQLANQIWSQPLMNTNGGNEQFGKAARPFVASSPGSTSKSRHNEVKLLHT